MTYQELLDDLIAWLNREGFTELVDTAPAFVRLAENRVAREMDLFCFEKILDTTTANTTVPADWLRSISGTISQGTGNYELSGTTLKKVRQSGVGGRPIYYTTVGEQFVYGPEPDKEYDVEWVYHGKLPPLTNPSDTNWITLNSPELYLWASLVEACLFLKDDSRSQLWEGRYTDLRDKMMLSQERRDLEPGGLAVREQQYRYSGSKRHY
jgi:hypothetical protein